MVLGIDDGDPARADGETTRASPSYPLQDVNETYGELVAGAVGRSIILPNGELDRPAWRGNEGDA
ncbi:MAG: hypothetical protein WAU75_02005 [Solirubrobacteraceae bacterium]